MTTKTEFRQKLGLLILDKLIFAIIIGGAILILSYIVDGKLEKLKSNLALQRIIVEKEIATGGRLWNAVFLYGDAFRQSFTSGNFNDLGQHQRKFEEFLYTEGAFIGIDRIETIKNKLVLNENRAKKLNKLIESHNEDDSEATKELEDFWHDYSTTVWLPVLREIENFDGLRN